MRYQVLSPIKVGEKIITTGYAEIADDEVAELQAAGVIGEAEPAPTVKAAPDGKAKG